MKDELRASDQDLLSLLDFDENEPIPADQLAQIRAGLDGHLAPKASSSDATAPNAPRATAPPASALPTFGPVAKVGVAVALLAAAGAGFVAGRVTATSPPKAPTLATPPAAAPSAPPQSSPASAPPNIVTPAPSAASAAPPASVRGPSEPSTSKDDAPSAQFDREQSLLERARTALGRHDAAAARSALDRVAREFPRGKRAEERDYLRVLLLREEGDGPGTRQAAAAFLKAYPDSLFASRVEAMRQ